MFRKILLITVCSFSLLAAQNAGSSGMAFLKLGFGARNIGMGDAATSSASDVTSLFYNPARLSVAPANEVMLMHNEWIQGVRSELLGARTILFGLPFAIGVNVTNINDIEVRNLPGEPITKFNANYFYGGISTGFKVYEGLSAGVTIKYLYEGIYVDEANGMGYDFGLNYQTPIEGLTAAAIIKNIGSMDELKAEKTKLPTEFRFGGAYQFNLPQPKLAITTSAEYQNYTRDKISNVRIGAEVLYDSLVSVRAGYFTGNQSYEAKNFTAGIGLKYGFLNFDYAMSPFTYGLGMGHAISLNFTF